MKFEHIRIYNMEGALRGMRFSFDSNHKSDSYYAPGEVGEPQKYVVGEADYKLALKLSSAKGGGHDKFLRQILVSVDMSAPEYFYKEFDTYKVGTVANSTSMMHTLGKEPFNKEMFQFDEWDFTEETMLHKLNVLRETWIRAGKKKPSPEWRNMNQHIPISFIYKRHITLNYGVLKTIYHQRKNHRLQEWEDFRKFVEALPYSEWITGKEE